jgi:hypothetical protein
MTIQETQKLMAVIANTYPSFQPKDPKGTLQAWAWALEPYDFTEIQKGLAAYIRSDTSGYAPAVGQLIGKARETLSGELSDGEAWGMVVIALRNGTYGAEREFAKLPEVVQKAVGSPQVITQWAQLEESMLTSAEASFKRAYKAECTRAQAKRSLNGSVMITGSMAPRAIEAEKPQERIESKPKPRKADIEALERRIEGMWQAKEA